MVLVTINDEVNTVLYVESLVYLPMGDNKANVICLVNAVSDGVLKMLQDDCDRLHVACSLLPENTGAALDPFEFVSICPTHPARSSQADYSTLRVMSGLPRTDALLLHDFMFSLLPWVLRTTLNFDSSHLLYLFNEHYVRKDVASEVAFRWHQDVKEQMPTLDLQNSAVEYFSCWCALDDVSPYNGTIAFPKGTKIGLVDMSVDDIPENCLCRTESVTSSSQLSPREDDRGVELTLPAGSVVIFPHNLWHRSGVNFSDSTRRVYYAQFSTAPITTSVSSDILSFAVPC